MRRSWVLVVAGLVTGAHAGCRVVVENEVTRPGRIERTRRADRATARPPRIVLDDQGRLRFVEPLECATDELVIEHRGIERSLRPNIGTFVVGIIATAAGSIALTTALTDGDRARNPITYAGGMALAVGLPLAIGPWIPGRTALRDLPDGPPIRRPGPPEACGERALAATTATLVVNGLEVHGAIDREGVFAISPFALLDAFAPRALPSLAIAATVDGAGGPRTIETIVDGGDIARTAAAFLSHADFDATIEPMRIIPNLTPGTLRLSLSSVGGAPMLRLVLPIRNDGPGACYALRGIVTATGQPAIDGRILYLGHIANGASLTRELLIPLAPRAADALRNASIEVSVELRDAHGTAPVTPVRFHGVVLVDAPRS